MSYSYDSIDTTKATRSPIPVVDLSGTPFEIGFQHGSKLSTQILSQLELYRFIFKEQANLEWSRVTEIAREFIPTIQRLAPHLFEEIEGISAGVSSKGSKVALVDIVALNSRSEIALGLLDDGCTSLAWTLGSTGNASRRQILAQNWDWTEPIGKNLAMASIAQPGKPKIWMVIEAGIVGKIGFNSASVGVCLNAIRARPTSTSLLPIHLILRIMMECTSISHAVQMLESLGGPASSQHILIADATSGGRGLEISPHGSVFLKPDESGVLVHTNHFLQNKLVDEPPWLEGSPVRLERIRELCTEIVTGCDDIQSTNAKKNPGQVATNAITSKLLRDRIFSDTQGGPQSICCYMPLKNRVVATLFNIVMQFEMGKEPFAEVLLGRPGKDNQGPILRMPW